MKIVAFIPAKAQSERVAGKNLRILDGDYLFKRKLRQALAVPAIGEVCLDTECDALAALADDLPVSRLARPTELASNATDGHALFAWECAQRPDADIWIQLLCTAPFVSADTIGRAIDRLLADPDADSLVGVYSTKQYGWSAGEPLYGRGRIPNSVDLPPTTIEAMSLYMVRAPAGGGVPDRRFGARPILFELGPLEQVDVNTPEDLALAETIAAGQRAGEVARFRAMRPHLSSTILADLMKERGHRAVVRPKLRATSPGTIFGRAKTLQLGRLPDAADRNADEWKGIYGALASYSFVRPGDVIMVGTDLPEYAYFGDLNANLAVRAGAVGVVVDGCTRDVRDVRALGLPVFAREANCDDIKFEGTLVAMNRPTEIGGVTVCNGDVVFADEDGIVVVPAAMWPEIEAAAWELMSNEARIRLYAAQGRDVQDILSECGAF